MTGGSVEVRPLSRDGSYGTATRAQVSACGRAIELSPGGQSCTWTNETRDQAVGAARPDGAVGAAGMIPLWCRRRASPGVAMQVLRHARFTLTMEIYTRASSKATRDACEGNGPFRPLRGGPPGHGIS